jgi:hypothetical protein
MGVGRQTSLHLVVSDPKPSPSLPLGLHVRHVVGLRTEKEVIDIDASALITAMANDHAAGNRTMLDRPSPSMGIGCAAFVVEPAISGRGRFALPDHAARKRIGLRPKSQPLLIGP